MKENRLINRGREYSAFSAMERIEASNLLLDDRRRIASIADANREPGVLEGISRNIMELQASLKAWTDIAGDVDGKIQTADGYDDADIQLLDKIKGSGQGPEAYLSLANSDKRLVFLINSNPRLLAEALRASKTYGPVFEAQGNQQYEQNPNGLPWVFSAGDRSLTVLQGWNGYSPLPDINPSNLKAYGVLGTATDINEILTGNRARIQFSSKLAPKAAEKVLAEKIWDKILWAVPDFRERYLNEADFRLLADTVLQLLACESWISYSDGFGNIIGQQRFDVNKVSETVEVANVGEDLNLVLDGKVYKVKKVLRLTDAEPGCLVIYNNGEDAQNNFNIVTPWIENNRRAIQRSTHLLWQQGVPVQNILAEITRARIDAARRGEGVLRLNAHNLLCGPKAMFGFTLSGSEVRVLRQGQDLSQAVDHVKFAKKFSAGGEF